MRIISGKHKGRRIDLGDDNGKNIRPTSDFARESIFNILAHGKLGLNEHPFIDKHVLDVFCGTGAFGLEALSRGAAKVTFIDLSREALAIAKNNASRMNEVENCHFFQADASKLPKARQQFPLVFLDPPYFGNLIPPALTSLAQGGWLSPESIVIIEHDEKENVVIPESFTTLDSRRYGRAVITLLKLTAT